MKKIISFILSIFILIKKNHENTQLIDPCNQKSDFDMSLCYCKMKRKNESRFKGKSRV